jgi:LysM repeat protein
MMKSQRVVYLFTLIVLLTLIGCERPDPQVTIVVSAVPLALPPTPITTPFSGLGLAPPTPLGQQVASDLPTYAATPTPDPPHAAAAGSEAFTRHSVTSGETLGYIAQLYGSSIEELLAVNELSESDLLFVGQELLIPGQSQIVGPSLKLIPDSELVYGPAAKGFDVNAFIAPFNGYLMTYGEEIEGQFLTGAAIVELVAHRYSVNPRLLLAVLEHRAGWVTKSAATGATDDGFPMGYVQPNADGLYQQLGWAANQLNWGYYGRSEGGAASFLVGGTTRVAFAPDINNGTAGVQNFLGAHNSATYEGWLQDVASSGFFATYNRLFGNPFAYTIDPLWPADLAQPPFQLPWPSGETWYFTGGPHGGWASGSAWAALDFVPAGDQLGCVLSDAWVTAMTDGLVSRSGFGAVVVDMDGDGFAGTGWAITYMHLESRDRIPAGTVVQTGDRLGHPSCEGGFSNGTHVHMARTYNGRWIAADGSIPFVMGGWVSQGLGREYDGLLVRGGVSKEACECREEVNAVTAD